MLPAEDESFKKGQESWLRQLQMQIDVKYVFVYKQW